MRLEKDICNKVPKRTKLNAERQRDYRKRKAQDKAQVNKTRLRQLTRHQLQLYTIIIKRMNTYKRIFGKIITMTNL
jgi:hypothetical protein